MATIAATNMQGTGDREVTWTTLTSSDTFTYSSAKSPVLIIKNDSGGSVTVNIDGDGATTKAVSGVGSVDLSSGFDTAAIADGETYAIPLDTISAYLSGTIAVTGASGAEAALLEF